MGSIRIPRTLAPCAFSACLKGMTSPLSLAEQIQVIHSRQDIAAWSLARLGLPAEWRDTNEPGNTARCQQAVDRLFTLTRAELEASLAAQNLVPEQLPHVETTRGSHDGAYFIALGRDRWDYYYQERGMIWRSVRFNDLTEARRLLLNDYLPIWLRRLHFPARTHDGQILTQM